MDNIGQIPRAQFLKLLIFYTIAHMGIFFILNAVYWDDWILNNMSHEAILNIHKESGHTLGNYSGYLYVLLALGQWFYKTVTFILSFATGILVWHIAAKQDWLNKQEIFFTVLFFLILPLYSARVVTVDFAYTLSGFFFFLAWSLMERQRVIALLLFLVSFNTQSLLVFYVLPIIDWCCRDLKSNHVKTIIDWGFSKIDFLLLPFVWFTVKTLYFKPYGMSQGYNEHYSWRHLISTPIFMVYDFLKLNINVSVTILISVVLLSSNILPPPKYLSGQRKIFCISIFALLAGTFPYMVLGYIPSFTELASRHQLLMPLGLALFFVWIIGLSKNSSNRKAYITFLIAICLTINMSNYFSLFLDWQKQRALIAFISHSSALKAPSLILFNDKTSNALNRVYRFYEWNGILKYALHDETHFGINFSQLSEYESGQFDRFFASAQSASQHVRSKDNPCFIVTIEANSLSDVLFHRQSITLLKLRR